jgi:hypothetical protein
MRRARVATPTHTHQPMHTHQSWCSGSRMMRSSVAPSAANSQFSAWTRFTSRQGLNHARGDVGVDDVGSCGRLLKHVRGPHVTAQVGPTSPQVGLEASLVTLDVFENFHRCVGNGTSPLRVNICDQGCVFHPRSASLISAVGQPMLNYIAPLKSICRAYEMRL